MNLIAVDIGNTRTTCGLFRQGVLLETWHHDTHQADRAAESVLEKAGDLPVALSSVVPEASSAFQLSFQSRKRQLFEVTSSSPGIISGAYESMGADRLANVVAGWKLYGKEHPVVVIDLGTATTLTAVSADGQFRGGLITLGLGQTLSALSTEAAQLPAVSIDQKRPEATPLAFATEEAITSGTILAHVGIVEHWLKVGRKTVGADAVAVATGGWSATLARYTRLLDHIDPYLTLKGIYLIAEAAAALTDPG